MGVAWVNGRILPTDEPAIAPSDHALVGDGVFEAIKVVDLQPFALDRHLDRLQASAEPLGIPIDLDRIRRGINEVLATDAATDAGSPCWLRVTVTAGSAPMATGAQGEEPTVVTAVAPMARWAPTTSTVTVPWVRNERSATAGLKTISYADNAIALRYAHERGADEAMFANTSGNLCEGAGSNVFVVLDGELLTPPLSSGCLAGVTRALLLEWMPEAQERDIAIDQLAEVEEAFLTSTSRDVHPIATLDDRDLPAPGPVTERAMGIFAARKDEAK